MHISVRLWRKLEHGDNPLLNSHSLKLRSSLLRVLPNGDTQTQDEAQGRISFTIIFTKTPRSTQFQLPHGILLRTVALLRQKSENLTRWLGQRRRWPRNQRSITSKRKIYTGCPTRYRTRHFFNNSNTNEDIATKFEQKYVRCVRNEEEYVCSVCM